MTFHFKVFGALNNLPRGELDPSAWKFNDPIWKGGSAELTLAIPYDVASLKRRTEPDAVQLAILEDDKYLWAGPINLRGRASGAGKINIKAQHWKSWLYTRLIPQKWFRTQDKFAMAYELIDFAVNDFGCPKIIHGSTLSGNPAQEFTINPFWSVGQALDSFAQRDDGFEWTINFRSNSITGLLELYLELFQPGEERGYRPTLLLDASDTQNRINLGELKEDATERRPRVFALNDGQWPDVLVVSDTDPALKNGGILLRESSSSYQGVVLAPTLFSQARSERIARTVPMQDLAVDHPVDQPKVSSYRAGDRARLKIKDDWEDTDIRGVRISDRVVTKTSGKDAIATVMLDLTDIKEGIL